ncbi:MAG: stage III sporulation protein AB [Lachnospiraceae bacterium]
MLRIIGIIFIFTGSIGLGIFYKQQYEEGTRTLYHLKRILELFISEISYGKATLHECLNCVADKVEGSYRETLCGVAGRLKEEEECTFSAIWKEEMERYLKDFPVKREEIAPFLDFTGNEGIMDLMMQVRAMEQSRDRLATFIKKREENAEKQGKLSLCLGGMGGLFLTIVLI